jgi:SAM-dependent methyltransferase
MSLAVQLDLVSGGRAELVLEDPDPFPSSYFISMEHSGNAEFWQVVVKLLAAAKRSVCKFGAGLRQLRLTRREVTNSAMRGLLQTNGYAFGIFWDVDPALRDVDLTDHKTFIFVRDPRDVVVSSHSALMDASASVPPLLDYVRSQDVDHIARRYHRFADFCRSAKNVTVFRYEDVMFSWRKLVVDLNEKLDLQISLETALAIADSSEILAKGSQITSTEQQGLHATIRERLDKAVISLLEEKFADPMVYFGYVPEEALPAAFLEHQAEFLRAVSERLSAANGQCSDLAAQISNPTRVDMLPLLDEVRKLKVSEVLSPDDRMMGPLQHYFYVGRSDLWTVLNVLNIRASYIGGDAPIKDILDFGCGHGRVARWFRAAFPDAQMHVTDLNKSAVQFCVENFGGRDIAGDIPARRFDLVWLGSVFTHLPEQVAEQLLQSLLASLRPAGVLVFTSQGRYSIERMKDYDWEKDDRPWMHYRVDRARFETIVAQYHKTGYGYVAHPGQENEGVCVAEPSWYSQRVLTSKELIQILFQEKGSANAQDVSAFMRTPLLGLSKSPLCEPSLQGEASEHPDGINSRPLGLSEPDPALLWRLKANSSVEMTVLGRRVVMDVDPAGCRPVVGQVQAGEKTLAVYGCSVTFGWAISAEETFCSLLQSIFPRWRVENHGVGGYGGTHNLIQLQRNSRWGAADYVTFCWIPHHMLRNVADPTWMQRMMEGISPHAAREQQQAKFPRASLDQAGKLQYRAVKFPRWDLVGIDWTDFSPDPYYLDLVCFTLFRQAAEIAKANGGHFFITTLDGHPSQQLQCMLNDVGIPVVDASVSGPEYTCLPDDRHPNALANRIYAEKIRDYLVQHEKQSVPSMAGHAAERPREAAEQLASANVERSELAAKLRGGTRTPVVTRSLQKPHMRIATPKAKRYAPKVHGYAEQDPVLLLRLKANASAEMTVLGRRVAMQIDSTGCRRVVWQPQTGEKTLSVYGCSFTFGWAIPDEETFCSLLQSMFPILRVENHGVPCYSGTQSLLRLQRNSRWVRADYVTFCWLPHHMLRNVGDPTWIQRLSEPGENSNPRVVESKFPRASLDSDGKLQLRTVRLPRQDLCDLDLEDFSCDPYYLDLVCLSLFKRAAEIVREGGGHFFVTTLFGHLSPQLQRSVNALGIPVVDASVHGDEYTCLPDDPHPNALANRIYAEKIRDYLVQKIAT